MRRLVTMLVLGLSAASSLASDNGTVPKSEASRYPASAEQGEIKLGASLLTAEQVRRSFATELSRSFAVVEVAVYPDKSSLLEVSRSNFVLRSANTDLSTRPTHPRAVAANSQRNSGGRDVTVYPSVGIGYESGRAYDPETGRERRGGVYTSAGVGVGVGDRQVANTERDREVMELELTEKGLPEGSTQKPVAGYLYFPYPEKKKSDAYQLECTLGGVKLVIALKP